MSLTEQQIKLLKLSKRNVFFNTNSSQAALYKYIAGDSIIYRNILIEADNSNPVQLFNNNGNLSINSGLNISGSLNVSGNIIYKNLDYQGTNIKIGLDAGKNNQGRNSIAIGAYAAPNNQSDNTIVLNASGDILDTNGITGGFFVSPIRSATGNNLLLYNNSTSEISYGKGINQIISITGNDGTLHVMTFELGLLVNYVKIP